LRRDSLQRVHLIVVVVVVVVIVVIVVGVVDDVGGSPRRGFESDR
jgi:type II secretory pathway component PulK